MNHLDSSGKESEPNVLETCWKWKLPHFTSRSTAAKFARPSSQTEHLIAQSDDGSTESLENVCSPNQKEVLNNSKSPKQELRSRSAGDISDSSQDNNSPFIIENFSQQQATTINPINEGNVERSSTNVGESSIVTSVPASSSGFLSFFGVRFNKSGTRHLERSANANSGDNSSDKNSTGRTNNNDGRYTKFPLSSVKPSANINNITSNANTQNNVSVSSVVDNSANSSVKNSRTKQTQLENKSKSDNNLHNRLNLNNKGTVNAPTSSTRSKHNSEDTSVKKLNSVQQGDHAPIRLPWTPQNQTRQDQNNLSSVSSSTRSIPNTHTNIDFNKSSARYIDTDFWGSAASQTHHHLPTLSASSPRRAAQPGSSSKRRSRSLERSTNFRVITGNSFGEADHRRVVEANTHQQHSICSNSLERKSHFKIRQTLCPSEENILLRNIKRSASNSSSQSATNHHILIRPSRSNELKLNENLLSKKSKAPLLKHLHTSSEPNSSFSSCDSSTNNEHSLQFSASAPPSPPPRPLSTLKSGKIRPVVTSFSFSSADKPPPVNRALKRKVSPFTSNSILMNSSSDSTSSRRAIPTPLPARTFTDAANSENQNSSSTTNSQQELAPSASSLSNQIGPSNMSTVEDARNSGFINKPSKGWLHADQLLTKEGVTYTVRYIGCLDVNTSMKSLDFDTRSLIAKECINQICEAAGLKSIDRKRRIDRRLVRLLGLRPRLEHAGSDVHLTITSTCLKLTNLESGQIIAVHEMPNISFASGGDSTMLDFVAYVAKDTTIGRACFVLECGSGLAQDVITTVGQAFELRFKEYLQKRPPPPMTSRPANDDPEYYNDLPGKVPPPVNVDGNVQRTQELNGNSTRNETKPGRSGREPPKLTLPDSSEVNVNLIDFEAPTPPAFPSQDKSLASLLEQNSPGAINTQANSLLGAMQNDPFDMQPFEATLNSAAAASSESEQKQLESEQWFHGIISRSEAEALVVNDGDFLVRESQNTSGQYVLTGIQNGSAKHLLLVDPEGVVRTKDRTFTSVTHLIRHHCDNNCPIISAESMVLLINPIFKKKVISQ